MKGRAFYWGTGSLGYWYAIAGAFQGALAYFPMELLFIYGGKIVQIFSWSSDNGDGVDDMTAFLSSNGEMIVYQGTDPSQALLWNMVGRFHVGSPLSVRSHGKVGSQEITLTSEGFAAADEAIITQTTDQAQEFGGKIVRASSEAVGQYANNFGWECLYYPRTQMFLCNVPVNPGANQFEQYVRNTDTGAWARFTGWNARTFQVFNQRLYFGDSVGNLVLADTSSSDTPYGWGDLGQPVVRSATTAYQRLTQPGMKSQVTGVQLVTNMNYPSKARVNIISDYGARQIPVPTIADFFATTYWDQDLWNTFYWGDPALDPIALQAKPVTYSVAGYGFATAVSYQYNYRAQQLCWYSTNIIFNNAGV
jgi:hypothetical protein